MFSETIKDSTKKDDILGMQHSWSIALRVA